MSVNRREIVKYLEANGFLLHHEGRKHSIYVLGKTKIPVKRHRIIDRITANQLCKQAGLPPKF